MIYCWVHVRSLRGLYVLRLYMWHICNSEHIQNNANLQVTGKREPRRVTTVSDVKRGIQSRLYGPQEWTTLTVAGCCLFDSWSVRLYLFLLHAVTCSYVDTAALKLVPTKTPKGPNGISFLFYNNWLFHCCWLRWTVAVTVAAAIGCALVVDMVVRAERCIEATELLNYCGLFSWPMVSVVTVQPLQPYT